MSRRVLWAMGCVLYRLMRKQDLRPLDHLVGYRTGYGVGYLAGYYAATRPNDGRVH